MQVDSSLAIFSVLFVRLNFYPLESHLDLPLRICPYFGELAITLIFGFLTVALVVLLVVLYGVLLEAGKFFWGVMRTFLLVALQPVE